MQLRWWIRSHSKSALLLFWHLWRHDINTQYKSSAISQALRESHCIGLFKQKSECWSFQLKIERIIAVINLTIIAFFNKFDTKPNRFWFIIVVSDMKDVINKSDNRMRWVFINSTIFKFPLYFSLSQLRDI